MLTEATKKFRDIFAYGLLGVAALYLISGLSLLFKSEDLVGPFSGRAALFGHLFTHPLLVLSLVGAVVLAVGFSSVSRNAKLIVTVALGIASAALLFALISWFSGFGVDSAGGFGSEAFGGVLGAGKIVSILLGLAQLLMLGLTAFFAFTAFKSLPKSAPKTSDTAWNQAAGQPGQSYQGYVPNQGYGQGPVYGQGAVQGQWQPQPGYGDPQVSPGYPPPAQPVWEQAPGQGFPQGAQEQVGWQPQETSGQPSGYAQTWGQPGAAGAAPEQRPEAAAGPPVTYPDGPHSGAHAVGAPDQTTDGIGDTPQEGDPKPPPPSQQGW
ncbi:MAG: hypothetical protein H0V49_03230 [Nocardioidaceae bacterium]|nr:hypothetical protein [Nocardioidaceae bacterium]